MRERGQGTDYFGFILDIYELYVYMKKNNRLFSIKLPWKSKKNSKTVNSMFFFVVVLSKQKGCQLKSSEQ